MELTIDEFLEMGDTDGNPEMAYNRGRWLKDRGRYSDAVKDLTDAINLKQNNMEAYIERSLCYLALKKYDLAVIDSTKAIELTENINDHRFSIYKATYLEVRSRIYIEKNDLINAFMDLNKSCETAFTNAFEARGILYWKQESYYESLCDFNQMAVMNPDNGRYPHNMGLCYLKMGEKNKAIEQFIKAKNLGSTDAVTFLNKLQ